MHSFIIVSLARGGFPSSNMVIGKGPTSQHMYDGESTEENNILRGAC
jgi:hypothetical protein